MEISPRILTVPPPTVTGVGLDLGSAGAIATQVKYASRSGWASRMNGGIFQASNSAAFTSVCGESVYHLR